jgi:hypothetical protein
VEAEYRDDKRQLTPGPEGYAHAKRRYDARGRLIHESFWSERGTMIDSKRSGYAQRAIEYAGSRRIERFLRASGAPGIEGKKYAIRETIRNRHGDEVERMHFDYRGIPVTGDAWWFRETYDYDPLRRMVGYSILRESDDRHGSLAVAARRRLDERGRLVEEVFVDASGKPIVAIDSYARVRYRHDAVGNVVDARFFGADDRPVDRSDGTARIVTRYDDRRQIVEERFYNWEDRPVGRKMSAAEVVRYTNDQRGNRTSERYFDASMKPVEVSTLAGRCFGLQWRYGLSGRLEPTQGVCLDARGRPLKR